MTQHNSGFSYFSSHINSDIPFGDICGDLLLFIPARAKKQNSNHIAASASIILILTHPVSAVQKGRKHNKWRTLFDSFIFTNLYDDIIMKSAI